MKKKLESSEEKRQRLQEARRIIGDKVNHLSDKELDSYLIKLQGLVDSWMDEYEKQVFEGKTLKEALDEPHRKHKT
ncbi:MAG: hypothetical protein WCI63_03790 [bacterium]